VWWISDNATGLGTLYNGAGAKQSLVVTIPQADPNNKNTPLGTPTGTIANSSPTDSLLAPGKPAAFLFSTIDGTIAAWNPTVAVAHGAAPPSTQAVTVVRTSDGSSYTGLTSAFINGQRFLYAANFTKGRVDVYDNAFHLVDLASSTSTRTQPITTTATLRKMLSRMTTCRAITCPSTSSDWQRHCRYLCAPRGRFAL